MPDFREPISKMPELPESTSELLLLARHELEAERAEASLTLVQTVLHREPQNAAAQNLLVEAEKKLTEQIYATMPPNGVPKIVVQPQDLAKKEIGPQEGFVLSRINGEWDIESILSILPFP